MSAASAAQKTLGLGVKVTAVRDVTFTAGAEFGLTRTVGLGVPATPPFNLFLGASYTVDLLQRGSATRIVETVRERQVAGAVAATPGRDGGGGGDRDGPGHGHGAGLRRRASPSPG